MVASFYHIVMDLPLGGGMTHVDLQNKLFGQRVWLLLLASLRT